MKKFNKNEYDQNLRIELNTMKAYVPKKKKTFKFVSMEEFRPSFYTTADEVNSLAENVAFNIIYGLSLLIVTFLLFYSLYLKLHDHLKDSIMFTYAFFGCVLATILSGVKLFKDYKLFNTKANAFLWLNLFIWAFNSFVWFFNAHF